VAKVTMPQLGESVAEGTIGKWLKQPGDHVDKYEPLLEVITDKVNAEVPSPFEGTLREILAEEGATVPNNAEIAVIETADEGATDAASAGTGAVVTSAGPQSGPAGSDESNPAVGASNGSAARTANAAGSGAASSGAMAAAGSNATSAPASSMPASPASSAPAVAAQAAASSPPSASQPSAVATAAPPATADPDARMTPAVRRLLREHDLSPAQIQGTGGGGRITRDDVLHVVEAMRNGSPAPASAPAQATNGAAPPASPGSGQPAQAAPAPSAPTAATPSALPAGAPITFPDGADEVLLPMTQMRKGIAAQMTRALAAPHAYVHMEVDATALVRAREAAKRDYQAREGTSLSYVPFVIKATVEALRRHPSFNAHWTDAGLVAKRRVNMGVAVAVDDGLLVQVVRDVDQLSISGLNRAIADVAGRARAGRLRIDDFGGTTFTIDNTGWFGSNLTMPIINMPEVAILTMEAITKRAVVLETPDGDVIAIRPVMNMVLAIDHRANDGAQAAAFLRTIKAWLEAIGPETPVY
jgi:pyruvate/2-oxoglutarate dehydrogenase complex dihydrolipoamide acyltransferase (E2) component